MLNAFDFLSILIMTGNSYFGYQTGVIACLFYILSGFLGMWAAQSYAPEPKFNFYLVFFAVAGAVVICGFFISRIARKMFLKNVDHLGGLALGFILGLAMIATIVLPVSHHLPAKGRKYILSSYAGSKIIPFMHNVFPKVKQFDLSKYTDKIKIPKMPEMPDKIDFKVTIPTKITKD